ncbi:uncharacterized protein LOC135715551 [Ochlerotatus camptorhynchus]|uniref:uncharacterized protein LOC135715551 n=1 Tax=Ochlerotatus camptorhynchus TaxID=644619 RepID=UPI0031E3156D
MESNDAPHSDGPCRHRFRCLLCSDTGEFCNCLENGHTDHPKQPLVSDELLLSKYGSKANVAEYSEIAIFGCPYCDRQQLSISTLYDHLTLEHLDVPFNVRCPICVCFGGNYSLIKDIHLSKHLVDDHSVTMEQYHEQILVYDTYCDDEKDLLKFIACTLPPTYYGGEDQGVTSPTTSANVAKPTNAFKTLGRMCSICLDFVFEASCRELTCKHKFHADCIDLWLQQSSTCPVCRKPTGR